MSNQPTEGPVTVRRSAGCCTSTEGAALSAGQALRWAAMFRALGDPVRLRLLSLIAAAERPVCVCHLTGAVDVSGPTISYHLKALRQAGLVDCERRGTWIHYWVRPEAFHGMAALLAGQERGRP